jgi:hypothetical protein
MGKRERPPIRHAKGTQTVDVNRRMSQIDVDDRTNRKGIMIEPSREIIKWEKNAGILAMIDTARQSRQRQISKDSGHTLQKLDAQKAAQAAMPSAFELASSAARLDSCSKSVGTAAVLPGASCSPSPGIPVSDKTNVMVKDHKEQLQDRLQVASDTNKDTSNEFKVESPKVQNITTARSPEENCNMLLDQILPVQKLQLQLQLQLQFLPKQELPETPSSVMGLSSFGKSSGSKLLYTGLSSERSAETENASGYNPSSQHHRDTNVPLKRNNRQKKSHPLQSAYRVHNRVVYDDRGNAYPYEYDSEYDTYPTASCLTTPPIEQRGADKVDLSFRQPLVTALPSMDASLDVFELRPVPDAKRLLSMLPGRGYFATRLTNYAK